MTTSIFNIRKSADYGTALTCYSASEWDQETRAIYRLGRRPAVYFDKFSDPDSPDHEIFQNFLAEQNITEPTQDAVAEAAAIELSKRIVTDDFVEKIGQNIIEKMQSNPNHGFDKIKVICPFPIDANETQNEFAPALNALVTVRLQESLPQMLAQNGLANIPVINEHDPEHADPEKSILNIVNNSRGSTSHPEPGKEGLTYVERLVRQPVYSGDVDQKALYVPVDDFLVAQSTLTGLMSYIHSEGGVTTNGVTGVQLFNGINVMSVQPETLEYLNTVIGDTPVSEQSEYGGQEGYEDAVQELMARVGLKVDFDHPENNTINNVEMMFLAGILADSNNPEHVEAFESVLSSIGSNPEEAKGNSPSDVFFANRMTLYDLEEHFAKVLEVRKPLIDMKHERVQSMQENDQTVDFN